MSVMGFKFSHSPFIHFNKRNGFVLKVKLKKEHGFATAWTFYRIITERKQNGVTPCIHIKINTLFFFRDSPVKASITFPVSGIDAIVTYHFEVLFRDVSYKPFDEFHNGNLFNNKFFIFMAVVMESNIVTIIMVDTFCGDNRSAEISAYVFDDFRRIAFSVFGINIETINMVFVNNRFDRFERRTNGGFKFIKKSGAERVS